MRKLEERHWLPMARLLGMGEDEKIIHVGCGDRPSLYIKHDEDGLWAYCHRCRASGNYSKTFQRIKTKAPEKTGWFPKSTMPFINAVIDNPAQFADVLKRNHLAPFISMLTYSPDTMRVYLPDTSGNMLGLDVTGAASARWYSPTRSAMACSLGSTPVRICRLLEDYLTAVRSGQAALITYNANGQRSAIAWLVQNNLGSALADRKLPPQFMKEIKAICSTHCY
ncbi:putative DNA primase [Aeromonas phage Atoyac15]|uniref:Putative DNA primase n=1 Tax=Aeromonas phage Atoyac15 TaxID=2767551 RepID=A0A866D1T5_9CAUD|nr:putative DNA primase [Aeromonas phage Atoyac15]